MAITGIENITYCVEDLANARKFFLDWGLKIAREDAAGIDFECMNGCGVKIRPMTDTSLPPAIEDGPTVREVVWAVENEADLAALRKSLADLLSFGESAGTVRCTDPNGLALGFTITKKRNVDARGVPMNTWGNAQRVDIPGKVYDRAEPVEVGHVVFFTPNLAGIQEFYTRRLAFVVSDRYPGRGIFLRGTPHGGHHDAFFLQLPTGKKGVNHIAFTVRDFHEVMGGGLAFSRCGWETDIGPGRHPISSAYFWYFKSPGGGLVEYYTDEDVLTPAWKPREFESKPENFAEWAILGGIDGVTRRQKQGPAPQAATLAGQAAKS